MIIQRAEKYQLEHVYNLLKEVTQDLIENGIYQWNDNYPTIEYVQKDINENSLFCALDGIKIVGIIAIDDKQSPAYENINWKYKDGKIMVIHRLAVLPTFQRKGIAKQLMDFALDTGRKNEFSAIRLDAYSLNQRTQKFYNKRGYKIRGEIYFPFRNAPFYCLEKKI